MPALSTHHAADSSKKSGRTRERKPRGRGLRTRTGCMTCRKRHLKCNEEKPICGPCARSNHTCVYADPTPIQSSSKSTSNSAPSSVEQQDRNRSRTASIDRQDTPRLLERISSGSVQDNHSHANSGFPGWDDQNSISQHDSPRSGAGPVSTAGDVSPSATHLRSLMQPCVSSQTAYAVSSPEAGPMAEAAIEKWFGLLAGDADFEDEPSFLGSLGRLHGQNGKQVLPNYEMSSGVRPFNGSLNSSMSGLRLETARTASHQIPYSHPVPPDSHLWQSTAALTLKPHEIAIFNHFVTRVSLWIDLFDPIRHFSTYVPHLAMHNVGLMNAILALSVRHMSLNAANEAGAVHNRNDSLPYYYETLHYVQKAMHYDSYNTSAELLATCLIISAYEMLDGSRKDWERHLHGVFWIQRSQSVDGDSFGLKQAVWWAWLCQDVWAAFREKRKPFNSSTPARNYEDMNSYDIAARSVYVMAQVVAYCSQEEIARGEVDIRPRIDRGESLAQMLDDWQRHLPIEFNPLPLESDGSAVFTPIWVHPPVLAVSIQVHCASRILLLLHRPFVRGLEDLVRQQKEIATYVETICGLAATTASDYASSIMTSQCLFIAGLCIRDPRQRTALIELLDACRRSSSWPIQSLSAELQMIWNGLHKNPLP
ncbi:hypothetical protein ABEF95_010139 [Exophiala dermatitidis]